MKPDEATKRSKGDNPLLQRLRWVSMEELLGDKSINLIVLEGEVKDRAIRGSVSWKQASTSILEKPPTSKLEPFQELVKLARAPRSPTSARLYLALPRRHERALEASRKGWLGDVFMIRATINSDRDMKQRVVEARYPGGSMFELGWHVIDLVIPILGRPDQAQSCLRHDAKIRDTIKDNTLAVFEYPSALGLIVSSNRDAASHRSFEVIGSDGSIMVEPMEPV